MRRKTLVGLAVLALAGVAHGQHKKAFTFEDVMKFLDIRDPVISADGSMIAYAVKPDRGNGLVRVRSRDGSRSYSHARGSGPEFSSDSRWLAARVEADFEEAEKSRKDKKKAGPRPGLALFDSRAGSWRSWERVERFDFSKDSSWLALHHFSEEVKEEEKEEKNKKEPAGKLLVLDLRDGGSFVVELVGEFSFDPESRYLVYTRRHPEGAGNGVYFRSLEKPGREKEIVVADGHRFGGLAWPEKKAQLAFLSAPEEGEAALSLWDGPERLRQVSAPLPEGWIIPFKNELEWVGAGERLFVGLRPKEPPPPAEDSDDGPDPGDRLYDMDSILAEREVDVWHWNDPLINSNQKNRWNQEKDRTFRAVYHPQSDRLVQLADQTMPRLEISENARRLLGFADVPYRKAITWEGRFADLYTVDLDNGRRTLVARRLPSSRRGVSLSPGGRFVLYYHKQDWHLHDSTSGATRNLTTGLGVPFSDEDHDYPSPAPGYGSAGWIEGDGGVLIYDKYDVWHFETESARSLNLTAGRGREEQVVFRILRTDPDQKSWTPDQRLLLSGYHDRTKHDGFYRARLGQSGVSPLLEEHKRFAFLAQAREAGTLLYTRESYDEFPDLWVADPDFASPRRLSDANPQMKEFAWGKAELVEWNSLDGTPLQGVLIKPGNYEPGRRYPVLVYFYRFMSQRLHQFNQPVINHRPVFALYASNDYAIFLPDIRFEVGRPGFAATKCLVPGVQKLIDMGVADSDAIGLHGHSWSGYQTAFVVTQTDIFAAAIAGAPVSNMTSAYGGIRWGSGLARQFQYERTQSRIGGSLWEYPERYIENSPLFFADRINTPLLILFGDEDGAVPWYQGIELYLAMRRLEKDSIFLQYRGEPHHPQKYPNKLDWAMKMKEYLDHYLKGEPAAAWIREGVPYRGK